MYKEKKMDFKLLFPQAHEMRQKEGFCDLPATVKTSNDFEDPRLVSQLGKTLTNRKIEAGNFLRLRKAPQAGGPEAYELEIRDDGITITAAAPVGAFYGLKTLEQLASGGAHIPCGVIRDWPDLSFRGLHFMCGGYFSPDIETLRMTVKSMSNIKLNKLVIEYDDHFPWEKHPEIRHGRAFTLKELRDLVTLGQENFIEIIPLIDSLGHCGPYLTKGTNARLRESPDNEQEMCPQNPESMRFIKELWEEVLEAHTESEFAQITGDEVFSAKPCPKCLPFDQAGRRGELYKNYYSDLSRWTISKGKTPLMWGDMFIKHPESLEGFPRDVLICDWNYSGPKGGLQSPFMEFCKASYDEKRRELFAPYWKPDAKGTYDVFPYLRFFEDQGFKTIACTSASPGAQWMAYLSPVSFYNNMRFAKEAVARHESCLGLLITSWGTNPVPGFWMGVVAGADHSWHSRPEEFDEFLKRFAAGFLRRPDWGDAILQLSMGQEWQTSSVPELSGIPGPGAKPMAFEFASLLKFTINHMKLALAWKSAKADGAEVLELGSLANCALKDALRSGARGVTTPAGERQIHGLPFRLDTKKVVCLRSDEPATTRLTFGRKISALVFWDFGYNAWPDMELAKMTVRYVDQSNTDFAFVGGVNISDWTAKKPPRDANSAVIAWHGRKDSSEPISTCLTLWCNPKPEMEIASIELSPVPSDKLTSVVVLGITALPGEFSWPVREAITPAALKGLEDTAKEIFPRWIKPYCVEPSINATLAGILEQK